ncbi:D-inositol-3-phosphate glycosyltransferase [Spiractinospora alimapuensis]|nr:D-inositol-3-phosphate glycosyltransferase [Spiractinospora alimapuensis]
MHTSPLEQPGTGDAGGLNVYVVEVARRLAERGIAVDVFTRATRVDQEPRVEIAPGLTVRHVPAGPFGPLDKQSLARYVCPFIFGVLRAEAHNEPGYYDLVHGHYWLSGRAGLSVAHRWGVPLVQSMHTLAKVKNAALGEGDVAEPEARVRGEEHLVRYADRLVANTDTEAGQLMRHYGAEANRVATVAPGVDLAAFTPGSRAEALHRIGYAPDSQVLLFVGRVQPHKAPDLVLHAASQLLDRRPELRSTLRVMVVGGDSGQATAVEQLRALATSLGISDIVRIDPPQDRATLAYYYRAAAVTVMPSRSESFGLVAAESQACGTPVVAADVGGLPYVVRDGETGVLVDGHAPEDYATALRRLLTEPRLRDAMGSAGVRHTARLGWSATVEGLLSTYHAVSGTRSLAAAVNL